MQHIEKLSEAWRLFTLPAYLPICLLCLSVYLSVCLLCLSHLTNITRMSRIAVGATATAVANHVIPTSARHSRTCARRRSNEPPQQHSTASACHIIDLFSIISPSTPLFSYTSYNTTFSLWIDVTEDATTQARRRHTRPPTTWPTLDRPLLFVLFFLKKKKNKKWIENEKNTMAGMSFLFKWVGWLDGWMDGCGNTIRPVLLLAFVDVY